MVHYPVMYWRESVTIVAINAVRVAAMVDPVVRGSVEDPLQGTQAINHLQEKLPLCGVITGSTPSLSTSVCIQN